MKAMLSIVLLLWFSGFLIVVSSNMGESHPVLQVGLAAALWYATLWTLSSLIDEILLNNKTGDRNE